MPVTSLQISELNGIKQQHADKYHLFDPAVSVANMTTLTHSECFALQYFSTVGWAIERHAASRRSCSNNSQKYTWFNLK